jgi:hypothetical protein
MSDQEYDAASDGDLFEPPSPVFYEDTPEDIDRLAAIEEDENRQAMMTRISRCVRGRMDVELSRMLPARVYDVNPRYFGAHTEEQCQYVVSVLESFGYYASIKRRHECHYTNVCECPIVAVTVRATTDMLKED